MVTMWYAQGKNCPYRVRVCEVMQRRPHGLPPIKVWRTQDGGLSYPTRAIKTWADLTAKQKEAVYRRAYHDAIADAQWQIAKEPALEPQFPAFRRKCREERDAALEQLKAGEDVPPPRVL